MAFVVEFSESGQVTNVRMRGAIDEQSSDGFKSMMPIRNGKVFIDLSGVTAINSIGVRGWLSFMMNFRLTHDVILQNCPPDVVMQINMISSFLGAGKVESFYAPYYCAACKKGFQTRFSAARPYPELLREVGHQPCPTCRESCVCDEIPLDYINFLRV